MADCTVGQFWRLEVFDKGGFLLQGLRGEDLLQASVLGLQMVFVVFTPYSLYRCPSLCPNVPFS